jgi:putative transposase
MEQRKEMVNLYVQKGLRVQKAVLIAGISKSTFYYKSNSKRRGKPASTVTRRGSAIVSNKEVLGVIEEILGEEFIDYGYTRVTKVLQRRGFQINRKKTYRLMKENGLLQKQVRAGRSRSRKFVEYTVPQYKNPFATIEIDIKYVYLSGERRNFYLITALDTFTRIAIAWDFDLRMTNEQVVKLLSAIKNHPLVKSYDNIKIRIRTDNGPQFIAGFLADQIKLLGIDHEFIQPGTPQQNGHIESFHSTIQKIVLDQYELGCADEARKTFEQFYHTYNNKRIMSGIADCAPIEFLQAWQAGTIGIRIKNNKQIFFRERQVISDTALSREDSFGCIKNTP